MNIRKINLLFFLIISLSTLTTCISSSERTKGIQYNKNEIEKRLSDKFKVKITIPEVVFSDSIYSNAQYNGEKILIGKRFFSDDYFTDEDRLSILFHEYMHSLTEKFNIFQCKKDSAGNIFQIKTNILYKKYLSEIEFNKDIEEMRKLNVSDQIIEQFREDAKKPVYLRFIYAPSNLSKDELLCYNSELTVGKNGLFEHSTFYKELIESRIQSELLQFKMRLIYEKVMILSPEGLSLE